MQVCGWTINAGQEGCQKSRPKPVLYLRTFQPGTSCYSKYGIMELLDVATGVVFIVDAFSTSDIFLQLRITHTYISPVSLHNTVYHAHSISLLFQYTKMHIPPLYFSPVLLQNIVQHPRCISLLLQYKILYILHALFLSCFSTKKIHPQRSISLLFQYTKLYNTHAPILSCFSTQDCTSPTLGFSPVSG